MTNILEYPVPYLRKYHWCHSNPQYTIAQISSLQDLHVYKDKDTNYAYQQWNRIYIVGCSNKCKIN